MSYVQPSGVGSTKNTTLEKLSLNDMRSKMMTVLFRHAMHFFFAPTPLSSLLTSFAPGQSYGRSIPLLFESKRK
jgi:hypothetical protein